MTLTAKTALSLQLLFAVGLATTAGAASPGGMWVASTDRLHLRQCPETRHCAILTTLQRGSRLEVLSRQGDWLRVRVHPTQSLGWVHSAYTQRIAAPSAAPRSHSPGANRPGALEAFIGKVAPFLFVGAGLFALGYSGRVLRRGVSTKQQLVEARERLRRESKPPNQERWDAAVRGANLRIVIPVILWVLLYAMLYSMLPMRTFLFSLAGLLLPVMGYLGFFLVPDLESIDFDE
jgi:hypothetical protein